MTVQKLCVAGLGYVGLPLAMKFAEHFKVLGFDINTERIGELKRGFDRNMEFTKEDFERISNNIEFTSDEKRLKECDVIIVAVPTPTKKNKEPDLSYLESASIIVGRNIKKGAIVVYESTVYPGCTEEFCVPILERESGLQWKVDFHVGYSPERINPGDPNHTIDKITKIVAGDTPEITEVLSRVYGKITKVYKASSIKVAEAAKVIENIQRDLNIALFNELAMLFDKLGLDSKEVFDAASTKWNFIRFSPGLVGGHCLPEDPYYLVSKALEVGYIPELITAGRRTNEKIPKFIAEKIVKLLIKSGKNPSSSKVLILGATYKENVPDLRNSKIKDLIEELMDFGIKDISLIEPLIDRDTLFGVPNMKLPEGQWDVIVYAVDHSQFSKIEILQHLSLGGILIDIKRKFNKEDVKKEGFVYWGL